MVPRTFVGIDYSMTSPAVATYRGDPADFHWKKVIFSYHTTSDSLAYQSKRDGAIWCYGQMPSRPHNNSEERFDRLSEWALHALSENGSMTFRHGDMPSPLNTTIVLEDYALGARGRTFEIAENTGLLKHKLRKAGYDFTLVAPTTVKKFATGKGNSDKDAMYKAWMDETDFSLFLEFIPNRKKIGSPVTDMVDAYYLLKYSLTLP